MNGRSCGTCDSTGVFDNLMGANGRFIIGDIDVETTGQNVGQYIFAVSKTNNPTAFDPANWVFYHVTTTEGSGGPSSQSWSDYPGNPGFNADAFVETFNMFGGGPNGTQVVAIKASDLAAGNPLVISGAGQDVFRNDVPGGNQNYRPTTMHDSVAGDPMWLIHNPETGTSVDVVKLTGVLSTSPSFSTTSLTLPGSADFLGSGGIGNPLNPDDSGPVDGDDDSGVFSPDNPGGSGAFDPGDRILKASENNNTIVASHTVAVASGANTLASAQPNGKNGNYLGGTGYVVGDILTVTGGTFTTAATLKITSIGSGGTITGVTVVNPGSYSSLTGITGAASGGTGTGAVFSLFFTGELVAEWYAINVSSGTPAFQMVNGSANVGQVGFGNNTYAYEPAIDINSLGQIGLGFMESDTLGGVVNAATGGFISTFVTGRLPTDPAGTMEAPVLVSAGTGTAPITGRIGDFSGMNVDPVNNSFWHVNEFGGGGPTVIGNFALFAFPPGISVTNGELLICGDQDNTDENDTFKLVRDSTDPTMLDVFRNNTTSTPTFQFPMSGINQINIYGGGGFNTLIVDEQNGVINVPNIPQGITFNAGDPCPMATLIEDGLANDPPSGEDGTGQLILQQTAGPNNPTITSDVYSPGPIPGNGTSVITDSNGNKQYIYFVELTPVYDSVPAASLTVNGTNAANAINYIEGNDTTGSPNTAWGQVTVDNQEAMNFTNKVNLVINGLAGSDEINLNNPNTPTGLTSITVNGQDPTASDTLVANGTTGTDTINFTPTAANGGGITGAGPVPITFTTIEQVTINGQGGNDSLTVTGTAGNDTITVTPGSTVDSGSVQVNSLVPLSYLNLGATGQVTVAGGGGTDGLVYNGTAGDDTFIVSATGAITLNSQLVVNTTAINNLTVNDLGGNDTVRVFGSAVFPGVVAGDIPGINVLGGEGNNRLDLVSTLAVEEDVEIDSSLNGNEIFGLGGPGPLHQIHATGVNTIRYDGIAGHGDTLKYAPLGGSDTLLVAHNQGQLGSPPNDRQGDVVTSLHLPSIEFFNLATFAVDSFDYNPKQLIFNTSGLSGATNYRAEDLFPDTLLVVEGSPSTDNRFTITKPVGTDAVAVTDNTSANPSAGVTITADQFSEAQLEILGGAGNDTLTVDEKNGLPDLTNGPNQPGSILFDGGGGNNTLIMTSTAASPTPVTATYNVGPGPVPARSRTMTARALR